MNTEYDTSSNWPGLHNLHINFINGITMSLCFGDGAYASDETVEVAIYDRETTGTHWLTREAAGLVGIPDPGETVDGYCNADRVHRYFIAAQTLDKAREGMV